jgi:hypothetical protein
MSGSLLHEAFPDTAADSGRVAKREERAKAKRCDGPALKFLKASDQDPASYGGTDPDRQSLVPLPPVEKMKGSEGFMAEKGVLSQGFVAQDSSNSQWTPLKVTDVDEKDRELVKGLIGQKVDDVIGEKSRFTLPRSAESASQEPNFKKTMYGGAVPSYFGKSSGDTEGYADFSSSLNDNPGYQLQGADFLGSFGAVGVDKASGKLALATPSVNDAWKPMTPSGARTSFFDELPVPGGLTVSGGGSFSRDEKESMLQKLDTLFARLEDLESRRNEYAHAEVTLFILSGLFLMFGIETVRKMN